MYYQITYKTGSDELVNDYLMEEGSIEKAQCFALHKVDGSYGETDLKFHSIKRVSRGKAIALFNNSAVSWCNDPNY